MGECAVVAGATIAAAGEEATERAWRARLTEGRAGAGRELEGRHRALMLQWVSATAVLQHVLLRHAPEERRPSVRRERPLLRRQQRTERARHRQQSLLLRSLRCGRQVQDALADQLVPQRLQQLAHLL